MEYIRGGLRRAKTKGDRSAVVRGQRIARWVSSELRRKRTSGEFRSRRNQGGGKKRAKRAGQGPRDTNRRKVKSIDRFAS